MPTRAIAEHCDACNEDVTPGSMRTLRSFDGTVTGRFCLNCARWGVECWVCKLPVGAQAKERDDGRYFCARDLASVIFELPSTDRFKDQVLEDLNRSLWRFEMKFPSSNVSVSLVSCASLYDLLEVPFNPETASVMGLTKTTCYDEAGEEVKMKERKKEPAGAKLRYEHKIYLATGLPEMRLKSVLAHELGHVWLNENLSFERLDALDRDALEGFCELVAYQILDPHIHAAARQTIRNNLYTMGQQNVLIQVDEGYGFHRVLRWFLHGTGRRLQNADLVRQVSESSTPQTAAPAKSAGSASTNAVDIGTNSVVVAAPAAVLPNVPTLPATIMLKGVMNGRLKTAMVNGLTFLEGDEQKVKLLDGPVVVKCVKINDASAVLTVNGETKEFFVGK